MVGMLGLRPRTIRCVVMLVVSIVATGLAVAPVASPAGAAVTSEVLILGSTVIGGSNSIEAQQVVAAGLTPVVVDDATWSSMTTAQFSSYRAIVLGDPDSDASTLAAAESNVAVWGPAVTGNVLLVGTDPVGHASQGGETLTRRGIDFSVGNPDATGLYFVLSQNYDGAPPATPVPILEGLRPGGFTINGQTNCYNDAHIVATHPALVGLSDATLSGWGCSVHEGFDSWPADFAVLAIARDLGSVFTASDGSQGLPYILASGTGLRSFPLSISPLSQTLDPGQPAILTAELLDGSTAQPVPDELLRIRIESGPNSGSIVTCTPATCRSNTQGQVAYQYSGSSIGVDSLRVWRDTDGNGVPDVGEPQTTALVNWARVSRFPCRELMLYFARGSGQWDGINRSTPEVGSRERNAFFSEVRGALYWTGRAWTIDEHDAGQSQYSGSTYNATGGWRGAQTVMAYFQRVQQNKGGSTQYYLSVDAGVDEVLNYLNDRAVDCPNEQWILGGYSQGAHMLGNVFSNSAFSASAKAHIRFVALFGDPKLSLNGQGNRFTAPACKGLQYAWVRGNVPCNADGGILGQRVPYLPTELQSKTGSWCDKYDAICAGEEFFNPVTLGHTEYPSVEIPDAASEAVSRLSIP